MASKIDSSQTLLTSYEMGKKGDPGELKEGISKMSPIQAFACLASYFAGQEETKMAEKLTEYEESFNAYKECLEHSKTAHQGKASAAAKGGCTSSGSDFNIYMNKITKNKYSNAGKESMDKGRDSKHNEDEWQSFADVLNQEKDIRSTDLNKISTEMDMAVKDSSEAEQMAANAIKKAVDLMSTQGRTAGG